MWNSGSLLIFHTFTFLPLPPKWLGSYPYENGDVRMFKLSQLWHLLSLGGLLFHGPPVNTLWTTRTCDMYCTVAGTDSAMPHLVSTTDDWWLHYARRQYLQCNNVALTLYQPELIIFAFAAHSMSFIAWKHRGGRGPITHLAHNERHRTPAL